MYETLFIKNENARGEKHELFKRQTLLMSRLIRMHQVMNLYVSLPGCLMILFTPSFTISLLFAKLIKF